MAAVDPGCGVAPRESPDGRYVYYTSELEDDSGIWRVPVTGGQETEVLSEPAFWTRWNVGERGLYFGTRRRIGPRASDLRVRYLDESGQVTELSHREALASFSSLTVSPDERWLLYAEVPTATVELTLVENFR